MQESELSRVLSIPISCPHCKRQAQHIVGYLIKQRQTGCPSCIKPIDLTGEPWRSFLDRFDTRAKGATATLRCGGLNAVWLCPLWIISGHLRRNTSCPL
jgi:hypothetical protein